MLHSSEQSDANCSRSTNASKLVIDYLDEPLEKQVTLKWFACHHMKTLLVELRIIFQYSLPKESEVKGGESYSQFQWFTIAKIELNFDIFCFNFGSVVPKIFYKYKKISPRKKNWKV